MKQLIRAISSETLKLKRTLALAMVFVAPLVVVLLQFMMIWQRNGMSEGFRRNPWGMFQAGTFSLWAVGMLPLFITLETALLAGLEHGPKSWKHLFALPVPRSVIYTAKLLVTAALIALSCLVLAAGTIAGGYGLSFLKAGADFSSGPHWAELATGTLSMFLASWLLIALHSWIALRWPSFALASGVGMAATVGTALISNSERFWKFYPWALPIHASMGAQTAALALTLGAFGGLVLAVFGCWDVVRRDVL